MATQKKSAAKKHRPAADPAEPDWRDGTAVRVRMYRHGLGDCFLLSFPRPRAHDFRVLIDCGVILGTPDGSAAVRKVVENLKTETDVNGTPTVDVLVATHEHWDHLSAFAEVQDVLDDFKIGHVWMSWAEDPENEHAKQLRARRAEKVRALRLGVARLRTSLQGAGALGADARSGEAAADFRRVAEVLSFFGIDPDDPLPPAAGALGAGAGAKPNRPGTADALAWCRSRKEDEKYYDPGDLIDLTKEVKGLRVYVLGPPTDEKQLFKDRPTTAGRETYEDEEKHQLTRAGRAFFGLNVGPDGSEVAAAEFERSVPFDPKYRIEMDQAAATEFFREHYLGAGPDDADAWRRIDGAGLADAAEFALSLDSDTNNTSLALAFELADGRVLLFPGDAQVGNWESWHADTAGRPRVWEVGNREVTTPDLLARTVVYKVGHHGSHNATLRDKGLELMTHEHLVALVPVDTYIAHEKKHWRQMPFDPLMARLRERTKGRVVVADETADAVPLREGFPGRLEDAEETIEVAGPDDTPVERHLYVDYFVPHAK